MTEAEWGVMGAVVDTVTPSDKALEPGQTLVLEGGSVTSSRGQFPRVPLSSSWNRNHDPKLTLLG